MIAKNLSVNIFIVFALFIMQVVNPVAAKQVRQDDLFQFDQEKREQLEEKRQRLVTYLTTIQQSQKPSTPEGEKAVSQLFQLYSGNTIDIDEVIKLLEVATEKQDSEAITWLGQIYFEGIGGVIVDQEKAKQLFEISHQLGNPSGTYHLGVYHLKQQGVFGDVSKAKALIIEADRKGYALAVSTLGEIELSLDNVTQAKRYYEKGIKQGDLHSMTALGGLYISGQSIKRDTAKGFNLLERAWRQGWHDAGLKIYSFLIDGGHDFEKNEKLAVQYLSEAAYLGSGDAYAFLCSKVSDGAHHLEKDIQKAIDLCKKGINKGSVIAAQNLASIYKDSESFKESYYWHLYASKKGSPSSMTQTGLAIINSEKYNRGWIRENNNVAYEWFKKSAELGWPLGMFFYAGLSLDLPDKNIPSLNEPDYATCWYWFSVLQGISPGFISKNTAKKCAAELSEEYKVGKKIEIRNKIRLYKRNSWTQHYLQLIKNGMIDLNNTEP